MLFKQQNKHSDYSICSLIENSYCGICKQSFLTFVIFITLLFKIFFYFTYMLDN